MLEKLIPDIEYYQNTRNEMLKYIPRNSKNILEFGCGIGAFGNLVKQNLNVNYWGVELHKESANKAEVVIDKVFNSSVEESWENIPDNHFDCIVFNDVLEHLTDPYSALINCKSKLSKDGVIVASIPNVRYYTNLYNFLVKKDWRYEDAGILDITHFRFFTEKSIKRIFRELGFELNIEGINKANGIKVTLFNIFTFGFFADTLYPQFACVAKI